MANPINDKYQEWRQTEQEVFDAYPVLKVGKPIAQTLLIPAIAANAATYLPLAGPVVAGAIGHGTDFIQNNLHGLRDAQVTKHFADLRQNIQPGFAYWARQRAFDDWATMRIPDLLAKSDLWTRPLSGYLAPTVIGKAMLDTAPVVAKYVTQLPISKAIGQTIDQTQALFASVQGWIQNSYENIREFGRHTEAFVQKEVNKLSNNQTPDQNLNVPKQEGSQASLGKDNVYLKPEDPNAKQQNKQPDKPDPNAPITWEDTVDDSYFDDLELDRPGRPMEPGEVEFPPAASVLDEGDFLNEGIPEFLTQSKHEPDKIAQDYFQGLASELGGKNMNTEKMKIFFNSQEVFRLSDGQPDLKHTSVTNEQMAAFKEALADPANFKGTLEIRQGSKLLLSIKDGQVFDPMNKVQDLLQVKMEAPAETIPQTTTQGFYQKYSEGVQATGIDAIVEIAKNAIEGGHSQAEVTSMLLENNPHIKAIEQKHGPEVARSDVQDLIQSASDELLMAKPEVQQQQTQRQEQQQSQAVSQSL